MSKYIPGNQKHLTLDDRIYIQNELSKGTSFKDIARFLCKDPTTISKEVKAHRLSDWYHKGTFIMPKTFVSTATIVKRPMPVGKSFFAVSSVLPALPATRPALTLKRNVAAGSIKLLMSAMAVINRFPIAPLLTNTLTMPGLLTANIGNALRSPAPVSA